MGGKGRGRGKAREPQQPSQQQSGQGQPRSYTQMDGGAAGPSQPNPQARAPAVSAWGPPARDAGRANPRADSNLGEMPARMGQMHLGDAGPSGAAGGGSGTGYVERPARGGNGHEGNREGQAGRGAIRGRRFIEGPILRTRPANLESKQGTSGQPDNLCANYFRITTAPDWVLHRYRVDFAPEEDRTHERKRLLANHRENLGGYLFDGTVLYTSTRLIPPQNQVLVWSAANTPVNGQEQKIYSITIKGAGEVDKGDYVYIQIFNLLLRTCISGLNLQLVGRDYFDADAKVEIREHRLEVWPGYKTSIRQHESDILMCVEVTHKVMRMETVLDTLAECYRRNGGNYQQEFMREIIGCVVLTKYNNKTYRIDDVDFSRSPQSTFPYKDNQITYVQYMLDRYSVVIRDMRQPMLVSRANARNIRAGMAETILLIPEVCHCTGLTDAMRSHYPTMRALAVHTRVAPDTRVTKYINLNRRLLSNENAIQQLKRFKMTLESDIVSLKGRILGEEKILFGDKDKKPVFAGPNVDWTIAFRSSSLLHVVKLERWAFVYPGKFQRDAAAFVQKLKNVASGMRFLIGDPIIYELQQDGAGQYAQVLGQIMDKHQLQLIMCGLSSTRGDRYAAIKKKCCVDRAVPTQVIQTRNLNDPKKTMSIATKVAVQINCKIGGAAWAVEIPLPSLMVVGYDACHSTINRSQSFGAMVASLDRGMSRYFSAVTPHTTGEELSNNFAANILKALRSFQETNGELPKWILIYRDGVGEGQLQYVHTVELDTVKQKLAQVYGEAGVKMTYVVVTKRINTRIFTQRRGNPAPGTIVDDVITDPEKYDFFLVSQSVREGTVSPTSYNIIHDGWNMPADRLQRLTYKMCHMYFNWSGTVRVPAPCQYAHKLAFLVGNSLHRVPSSQLENVLYFL